MNYVVSLEDIIAVIRESQRIPKSIEIVENTLLEEDLGITGDDGLDFLFALQKKFHFEFDSKKDGLAQAFRLDKGQYVFHSEGFSPIGKSELVKQTTVKDVINAVNVALSWQGA